MDTSQLATRQDLAVMGSGLRQEMADLRAEMHELFREQTNRMLMFVVPAILSSVGLAVAASRLG